MHDTTTDGIRHVLRRLIRHGLMEPHEHAGILVSPSEIMAFGALAGGPLSQQDLADELGLEKSTVSRLAAGMEERGWLTRERDPANRRFYRLHLTPAGRTAHVRIEVELRAHHARLLGRLTAAERQALHTGLNALARAMDEAERA